MYRLIKNIIKKLLPQKMLFKLEPILRSGLYQFYKGNRFACTVCEKQLKSFVFLKNGEQICPSCGSNARTRKLATLLFNEYLKPGMKVLDFSPSRGLFHRMKKMKEIEYFSSDFVGEFMSDYQFDLTNLPLSDESFDLVICYHVLEHIEKDQKGIKEVFRVLKNGGKCLVQTPFKQGKTLEDPNIKSPKEREIAYGQHDHVRIYSVEGLRNRLQTVGFEVEILDFESLKENYHGFKEMENVLVGRKAHINPSR